MTEILREYGPELERLCGRAATILIRLIVARKRCLDLHLEVFPRIVSEWAETWKIEEAVLDLLVRVRNFVDMELTIIQKEEREPTFEEIKALKKLHYHVGFCHLIIREGIKLTRESIMPESFAGALMAVRNPYLDREAGKELCWCLLKEHLNGKPFHPERWKKIEKHIAGEVGQLTSGNLSRDDALCWWLMPHVPDAVDKLAGKPMSNLVQNVSNLQNAMSSLVTHRLLGPGWTIKGRIGEFIEELFSTPGMEPSVMAKLELETLSSLLPTEDVALFEAMAAGVSQAELAAQLDIKPATVRQRVSRARQKIKKLR